jgi:hypothetical protein
MVFGFTVKLVTERPCTLRLVETVFELVAITRRLVSRLTTLVVTVNVPDVCPAGIVIEAGTCAAVTLRLVSFTNVSTDCTAESVTVPVDEVPPATEAGLTATLERVAAFAPVADTVTGVEAIPLATTARL